MISVSGSLLAQQIPSEDTLSTPSTIMPRIDVEGIPVIDELDHSETQAPDTLYFTSEDSVWMATPDTLLAGADTLSGDTLQPAKSESALNAPVVYDAKDSVIYDVLGKRVLLYGEAEVNYEDIKLQAYYIEYGFQSNTVIAKGIIDTAGVQVGYPVFTEGGSSFDADTIRYNFVTKKGLVHKVYTQEDENYIHSEVSKYHPNGQIHNYKGKFTTCSHANPHYAFHFKKLIMIPEDKIVSGSAMMKFRKIPTPLILPFGLFPIENKEKAGVLIPTWGDSPELGFFLLNGGYYIPINDYVDTKIMGDIYTNGSWALRNFTNYKKRYRFNGDLNVDYNRQRRGDPDFDDLSISTQFFLRWNHMQDPKARPDSRFSASLNMGSSNAFTNNLNSTQGDFLTNTFQSNVQYTKTFPGKPYSLSVNARHSQNSRTGRYDFTLPQATFNLSRVFLPLSFLRSSQSGPKKWYEKIGLTYQANFENRLSVNEEDLNFDNLDFLRSQFRNGVRHNAGVSTSLKVWHFAFNPSFNYTDRWYFQRISRSLDPESLTTRTDTLSGFFSAPDWNVNGNLTTKIYGMYQFKGEKLKAIRHVVTPTVGFNYRPSFDTRVFGFFGDGGTLSSYSPFEGGIFGQPSTRQAGVVNMSLINNIEAKAAAAKSDTTGASTRKMKLIDNLTFNTTYDLFRDSLKWSNINISGRTMLFQKINVNVNTSFSPYSYDEMGRTINRSMLADRGQLLRFSNANVAIGGSLQSQNKRKDRGTSKRGSQEEMDFIESNPEMFVDWNVPWTLNLNYTMSANKTFFMQQGQLVDSLIISQGVMFNGDITVLEKWKIGVMSGFDFVTMQPSTTQITIYWDLHCWELQATVIPFGIRRSYQVHVNVKAQVLQDLKLQRRGNLGSNANFF
ncbi:MAG: hypothetical protein EA392_07730 [Cryomorphaceae bacterium]|nr:MAG: hypothetical protein EA392_07730 [Cryomorphaceae bacterium]